MAEVRYFEVMLNISGTTVAGVYARSEKEAFDLLKDYLDTYGLDWSADIDLDSCEIGRDISELAEPTIYCGVINYRDDFQEEQDD